MGVGEEASQQEVDRNMAVMVYPSFFLFLLTATCPKLVSGNRAEGRPRNIAPKATGSKPLVTCPWSILVS